MAVRRFLVVLEVNERVFLGLRETFILVDYKDRVPCEIDGIAFSAEEFSFVRELDPYKF